MDRFSIPPPIKLACDGLPEVVHRVHRYAGLEMEERNETCYALELSVLYLVWQSVPNWSSCRERKDQYITFLFRTDEMTILLEELRRIREGTLQKRARFLADVLRDGCTFFKELGSHVNFTGLDVDTQSYDGKEWTQGQWSWAYNKIINKYDHWCFQPSIPKEWGHWVKAMKPLITYAPPSQLTSLNPWKAKTKKVRNSTTNKTRASAA